MSAILNAGQNKSALGGPSFSLENRIRRALWRLTWILLASWTPPQMRGWRRIILRAFGADVSKTAIVYGSVNIWLPSNLKMDEYSSIGPGAIIYNMAEIVIGRGAVISQRAHLCAGTHDIESEDFQLKARPITVGDNAWIATEAFVGPGVTVGVGAVLGARAVAMRDIAPWSVHIGNPAVFLRNRHYRPA